MIISASRRTDIPAFYAEWFINRIKEEYLFVRNPFNHNQVRKISLAPNDVDAIVFWTRNPSNLINYLNYLNEKLYKYYFQYTITGYPRLLEANTPNPYKAIETFQKLSLLIGKEKVIWRFDPIIFSNQTDKKELLRLFSKIANELKGFTNKVVISFYDNYKKTEANLNKITNLVLDEPIYNGLESFVIELINIAQENKITVETCSENLEELNLNSLNLHTTKCIDDVLLNQLFNINLAIGKDKNQRQECGCIQSVDIGVYNTCMHGCSYCYATYSSNKAKFNYGLHDVLSPFLIPSSKDEIFLNRNQTLF